MSFGEWLKQEFHSKVDFNYRFTGCTSVDVEFLRQNQGVACIPRVYQEILLSIGRSGLDFVVGGEGGYDDLIGLKQCFEGDMTSNGINYPRDAFVFFVHQGYIYNFFRTKNCIDDPPVYGYTEGSSNFAKLSDHISDFFRLKLKFLQHIEDDFTQEYSLVFNSETDEMEEYQKNL